MTKEQRIKALRIAAIIVAIGLLFVGFYYNKAHPLSIPPAPTDGAAMDASDNAL